MARFNQSFFFLLSGISLGVFTELFLPEPDKARVGAHLMEHLFLNDAQIDHSAVFGNPQKTTSAFWPFCSFPDLHPSVCLPHISHCWEREPL